MDLAQLRQLLASATDQPLADELVDAFEELKVRYYAHDFRPGSLEAGRFAEAAIRVCEHQVLGSYTPIGKPLPKFPALVQSLGSAPASGKHDSLRLHIPRVLAGVYDVRNRRDIGHIAADVDANSMDAEYVRSTCSWVLAELVRLFYNCSAEQAQRYVEAIVERRAPLVDVLGGEPFVTRPGLTQEDEIVVLLYHQGSEGATSAELGGWIPGSSQAAVASRLVPLERDRRLVSRVAKRAYITTTGIEYVENELHKP